jgi:hypothetical protein
MGQLRNDLKHLGVESPGTGSPQKQSERQNRFYFDKML